MTLLRHRVANATIDDWLDAILTAAEETGRYVERDAAPL
jgi:hypothetical protein